MALDPYIQLEVPRDADAAVIKAAYRNMARRHHPDKNPDDPHATTRFQLCKEAYEILMDADRRARYDQGEDASAINLAQEARNILISVFLACLKETDGNGGIEWMAGALKKRRSEATATIRKGKQANDNIESARDRFKFNGDGANILSNALDGQLASNVAEIQRLESARNAVDLAIKLLENYDDVHLQQLFHVDFINCASRTTA